MKIRDIISETFEVGYMDEVSKRDFAQACSAITTDPSSVTQVRQNSQLYRKGDDFVLTYKAEPIAILKMNNKEFFGEEVKSVVIIYVLPEYRKTSALYWLLYSVKESVDTPIIVDGPIFADGQALLRAMKSRDYFTIQLIDKRTGEEVEQPSFDTVYKIGSTKTGFNRPISESWVAWFDLFNDLQDYGN